MSNTEKQVFELCTDLLRTTTENIELRKENEALKKQLETMSRPQINLIHAAH
jgi:regulator of replication initiation timing